MSLLALLIALLLILFFNQRAGSEAAGCLADVDTQGPASTDAAPAPSSAE